MVNNKSIKETISLKEYPSIHYAKFFSKFANIDTLPIEKWDLTLILAYFCKRYKEHYSIDYTFKFDNTSPSKSYEVYQTKKLASMLSSDPLILKDYIDHFFTTKIIAKKRRITSMAYLVNINIINEYKFDKLFVNKENQIDRTTKLPLSYIDIIKKYNCNFTIYGELSFLKRCIDAGNAEQNHIDMFNDLAKEGMDMSILDRVK